MPAKNGRGLDEQDCLTPSWRHSRREDNHEALPGSPPKTTGELRLGDDTLLTKKRGLSDQFYAASNEIRGYPGNEPKKVDHMSVLHRLRADGVCSQDGGRDQREQAHCVRSRMHSRHVFLPRLGSALPSGKPIFFAPLAGAQHGSVAERPFGAVAGA